MSVSVLQSIRRRHYFWVGTMALCLLTLGSLMGVRMQTPMPKALSFAWSVATGAALLGCIVYQWSLLFARLAGRKQDARHLYQRHRQVGAVAICLFVLHAGGVGYALLTVLASVFLIIAVTGLLNGEAVVLGRPWLRPWWNHLHVALSGLLLPLIALHVWAALAFK
ncbi:MAG: hypothetical protein K2X43_18690 [Hyphomonadaceae bacterium]|jgi:hypothetical protein|nr:hypothetical protein [Hyphomonadaceae bacterium]